MPGRGDSRSTAGISGDTEQCLIPNKVYHILEMLALGLISMGRLNDSEYVFMVSHVLSSLDILEKVGGYPA